ncbi:MULTISPECIES: glycosyl hydrolase family 8 [unclassified Aureimonas]|uniref:glycosyl hydrolase family 8 n=1 Tax=unclassified Aureimonas TaxID=2615206 RepID=UPI0006F307DB|nr:MULTISPECIES: glycosyl hydrolase family 8 [unclassified Aureimonas]KQT64011.1 hypothetical protein ASG62_03055 [Aureimonas sp. Leaf427]KQT81204.1 hypothetical protein ASG54_00325 [Aureimonas sp. Leaf460]
MVRIKTLLATVAALLYMSITPPPSAAAPPVVPAASAGEDLILGSWMLYASRFVSPEGRVIDDVNGGISHSEGQGYGMLMAVAADDRASFERMHAWTKRELFVRGDGLAAWRWAPEADPHVTDRNDATDGDLLIAWALLRASKRWDQSAWQDEAKTIVDAVVEKAVTKSAFGELLLPAVDGFREGEQADGPVVNLSYWVFPALEELGTIAPKLRRSKIADNGLRLLKEARFGQSGLPADWTALASERPMPASGFPAEFGYNAIRIPLYLAWSKTPDRQLLSGLADSLSAEAGGLRTVDLATGMPKDALSDPGYRAVNDVVRCALGRSDRAEAAGSFQATNYYPSTLHILALMALAERYPQCLR